MYAYDIYLECRYFRRGERLDLRVSLDAAHAAIAQPGDDRLAEVLDAHRLVDEGDAERGCGVEDRNDGQHVKLAPVPNERRARDHRAELAGRCLHQLGFYRTLGGKILLEPLGRHRLDLLAEWDVWPARLGVRDEGERHRAAEHGRERRLLL